MLFLNNSHYLFQNVWPILRLGFELNADTIHCVKTAHTKTELEKKRIFLIGKFLAIPIKEFILSLFLPDDLLLEHCRRLIF